MSNSTNTNSAQPKPHISSLSGDEIAMIAAAEAAREIAKTRADGREPALLDEEETPQAAE